MVFIVYGRDGRARAGTLSVGGRSVETPFFMPVATKGTIKHLTFQQLAPVGTQAVIMNAFILSLRPTDEVVRNAGGLHRFTTYDGIIATDSGGFQVLSPTFVVDKNDDGVFFRNPFNGQVLLFRPEDAVNVQHNLGSDIAMVLDDQPPFTLDSSIISEAVERTVAWARRCVETHREASGKTNPHQLLFPIGQGGVFSTIREDCARALVKLGADGYAVGGLAIGEPPHKMYEAISCQTAIYPEDKPRYVMGLGSPVDILEAVSLGADMFDSIFPTQNARRGSIFTTTGLLRIGNSVCREDFLPVDVNNPLLAGITRAYLHHLLRVDEAAGLQLATIQNLWFMRWMMRKAREHILAGSFGLFKEEMQMLYARPDAAAGRVDKDGNPS